MLLMIDNYDSFTFNLVDYLRDLGAEVVVRRNDGITLGEVEELHPSQIVISPGPGSPAGAGICLNLVDRLAGRVPILGVCLGHQTIGAAFGGRVVRAPAPAHGKTTAVTHDNRTIFRGLPNPFIAARYHSLVVNEDSIPSCLEVSARSSDGLIMGLRHREYQVEGVQFHPESILTEDGKKLLNNFLTG